MAHHIADLVAGAEGATGEQKDLAEKNCFKAILALWQHRAQLPDGKRPFEDLEPVVRAIESLDPESKTPRYFRFARPPKGEGKDQSEMDTWIAMADGVDYSARVLVGYCLSEAARVAVDKSKEWVKLAEAAAAEDGPVEVAIRFVSSSADIGKNLNPNIEVRKQLQDRIGRLEGFIKLAESVARDLKGRLEALPTLEEGEDIAGEGLHEPEPNDRGDT